MIEWKDVHVRYPGAARDALAGVSLVARAGLVTAVVGPNGSGKSTLVRALLRRIPLAHGQVLMDEISVAAISQNELARRVAVVVQREEPAFPIRASEYIALGRTPYATPWGGAAGGGAAAIEQAVALAGVGALLQRHTDELSGGEWQRIRLARAVAQESHSIVLDEPTTFLDVAHEMSAFELLSDLARRGRTVVVVSHQLNLVSRFAGHVVLLNRGTVAVAGSPDEVMRAPVLEEVYEWPLVVSRDPAIGAPTLVPLRRARSP